MKIALISDIHGNLNALEAVLADIKKEKADQIICLGDVATIGPQPVEVIRRLKKLRNCQFIMGNHDAALLNPEQAEFYEIASALKPMLNWCAGLMKKNELEFLRAFQPVIEIPLNEQDSMLCFHGSPDSNTRNIYSTTPGNEMEELFGLLRETVMVGGHTHIQMLRKHHGKLIINAGSVGSAFRKTPKPNETPVLLPWAEYAVVEIKDNNLNVSLKRIEFDTRDYKNVIENSSNPLKGWLSSQY